MTNSKLQAALDELERLRDTVLGFAERNGNLPHGDGDASHALYLLKTFAFEMRKLSLDPLIAGRIHE